MSDYDSLHNSLRKNLEDAMKISEINSIVIQIAKDQIRSLGKIRNPQTGADATSNQILILDRIKENSQIKDVLPIVYGQQIVLMVSALEQYLNDVVKTIGNCHRSLLRWPEKSSGKIDLKDLDDRITIGDLILSVLEQKGVNFQDLGATKRFFSEYMGIELKSESFCEEGIILATAVRHSIVHSGGKADQKFMNQIRNISQKDDYEEGEILALNEDVVSSSKASIVLFSNLIREEINKLLEQKDIQHLV